HRNLLDQQQAVRCLPLPLREHAPHTKKPLLIEQGLPLPQRTYAPDVNFSGTSSPAGGDARGAVSNSDEVPGWRL
ncbi:hypothetical protein, partial [Streptomyces sp. PH10-H1]|uniref:hypothetical protein n=1 Tax=Streptomyces sp. PH10-H1 TaxID=3046212 RepID=UPI0024BB3F75